MKESGDFHLLKLVFKALYSAAWPSYLKINELVQMERMTKNDSFQDNAAWFF